MDLLLRKISHEMGNAMTIVQCSLNILKSECPQVNETKYFGTVVDEIGYMERLLKDMSAYNNQGEMETDYCNIEEMVKSIIASVSKTDWAEKIQINLFKENQDEIYMAKCDQSKIKQMLINLIKNSAEAITETDKIGKIDILLERKDDEIIICVTDNGCGIEEKELDNIFEPLVTYKKGGTGLGLVIVKDIVDKHNGKIKVVSEKGTGTTFEIKLPINLVAGKAECLI